MMPEFSRKGTQRTQGGGSYRVRSEIADDAGKHGAGLRAAEEAAGRKRSADKRMGLGLRDTIESARRTKVSY